MSIKAGAQEGMAAAIAELRADAPSDAPLEASVCRRCGPTKRRTMAHEGLCVRCIDTRSEWGYRELADGWKEVAILVRADEVKRISDAATEPTWNPDFRAKVDAARARMDRGDSR